MAWETIYYIGQTIAVVAIVLSLIFVGVQIRQNTAQAKADATEATYRSFLDWYHNQTPETAEIFARSSNEFDTFDAKERFLFFSNAMPFLMNLQEAHAKWAAGALAEDRWRFWDKLASGIAISPGIEKLWAVRRFMFSDAFQNYFDEAIRNKDATPPTAASWVVPPKASTEAELKTPPNEEPDA
ncbi:MAG: hypothetical protein AAF583_16220 [Pseudomonadota bacterium]